MNIENQELTDPSEVTQTPEFMHAGLEPLADFAARVDGVELALESLEQITGTSTQRSVKKLRRDLENFEPAVTFLGQVKSGKTSLVNAMAGWADLLPSDVNPWTSVVTSLHLKPGPARQEIGAKFQLMEQNEWDRLVHKGGRLGELAGRAGSESELENIRAQIEMLREKSQRRLGRKFELLLGQEHEYGYFDKNLLERYICIGDDFYDDDDAEQDAENQGRFADITRTADLFLTSNSKPFRMCLRDTPGVNDTFMMREQVTINAVRSSRICVVVLSAHQALTSVDMALIRMISSLESRDVMIFVNRIDELSAPAEQIPEIEASIRKVLADHEGPEDAHIVFGSAFWANAVLSEDAEVLDSIDLDAMSALAELQMEGAPPAPTVAEAVWHMSGLPILHRVMSERVVAKVGDPMLEKITSAAITIASGQQAANKIRVEKLDDQRTMSMNDVRNEVRALAERHEAMLAGKIEEIIAAYQTRADRAHVNFVDRATQSLISHLEDNGNDRVWSYSPTGLRMLLKSAYSVFAVRAQKTAHAQYEMAVVDIAELYFNAFGKAVEGIELTVPAVDEFPAPVSLAQTIALDFNDSWWVSWWRRTRGYKAFAKQFNKLVSAETADFMEQLKVDQTALIRAQIMQTLSSFFEQNRDIMIEIGSGFENSESIQRICMGESAYELQNQIDYIIEDLKYCAAPASTQGV